MTNRAHNAKDTPRLPPAPAEVARLLLAAEVGEHTSPADVAAAGERIYIQLRARLTLVFGTNGFDALWARAIVLAQPLFQAGDDPAADTSPPSASGLHAAVRGRSADAVQHNLVVTLTNVITLLFTFIGGNLGFHFICQIWPDLLPAAAESHTEGAIP